MPSHHRRPPPQRGRSSAAAGWELRERGGFSPGSVGPPRGGVGPGCRRAARGAQRAGEGRAVSTGAALAAVPAPVFCAWVGSRLPGVGHRRAGARALVLMGSARGSRSAVVTGTFQAGLGTERGDPEATGSVWGSKNCGLGAAAGLAGVLWVQLRRRPFRSPERVQRSRGETALAAELGFPQPPRERASGQALARLSAAAAASSTHRSSGLPLAGAAPWQRLSLLTLLRERVFPVLPTQPRFPAPTASPRLHR